MLVLHIHFGTNTPVLVSPVFLVSSYHLIKDFEILFNCVINSVLTLLTFVSLFVHLVASGAVCISITVRYEFFHELD